MPVLVIGADTETGRAVVEALAGRSGEVRAFVTDAGAGSDLKERRVKVAVGDVSDSSHVSSAALNAFSAVLIAEAAEDGRERAFAIDPAAVVAAWADALAEARVRRAIWVGRAEDGRPVAAAVPEFAVVGSGSNEEIAAEVVGLDEAARI